MADFPDDIYSLREIQNLPGIEYNVDKKTAIFAEDIQGLADEITAIETYLENTLLSEWTDYTPVLAQGASTNISKTINRARYKDIGKTRIIQCHLVANGTGTAGSAITVSLPSACKSGVVFVGFFGMYSTTLTKTYIGGGVIQGTQDSVTGARDNSNGGSYMGANPNVAVASGDNILVDIVVEQP